MVDQYEEYVDFGEEENVNQNGDRNTNEKAKIG
jgi:hypothetical protein